MTTEAPAWFRTEYEDRVSHIYQTKGNRLRHTVTQATSFPPGTEKVRFYLAGKTIARKIDGDTAPVPGGGPRKFFDVPLSTWQAFDETTDYDMDRTRPKENEVVYEAGAMALGRATDKEIYDVMKVAAPAVGLISDLDFSAAAFTAAQAMLLVEYVVDATKLTDGLVFCGLPLRAWNNLMANKQFSTAEWIGPNNLPFNQMTESRYWNGCLWFLNMEETAGDFYEIPTTNKQDAFIWHQSAVGWGNKEEVTMIPQWDNRMRGGGGWTFNMKAKGAATTLQEGVGIFRFRVSKNAAIAFT